MRKIYVWLIPGLLLSCSISRQGYFYALVPNYVKRNFNFCYDGKPTGIENLIHIDGYFKQGDGYLMFYRDGSCSDRFFDFDKLNIHTYFEKLSTEKNEKIEFENGFDWGRYILSGDTIKMFLINHPASMANTWMSSEELYKIKDKNTLKLIGSKTLDPDY